MKEYKLKLSKRVKAKQWFKHVNYEKIHLCKNLKLKEEKLNEKCGFCGKKIIEHGYFFPYGHFTLRRGRALVCPGDYIVKNKKEISVFKKAYFEDAYKLVDKKKEKERKKLLKNSLIKKWQDHDE